MAIIKDDYMPANEIALAFDRAKNGGYRFLVVIEEVTNDTLARRRENYTRAVETADEIVPLLRRVDRIAPLSRNTITQIYDLTRSWDEQKTDGMALQMSYLPEKTRHDLRVYYEASAAAKAALEAERAWAQQPLIKRLFSAKPGR
jgi:hypothetical protein